MKLLISILALGLVFSSFAQDSAKFEEHKKMIVALDLETTWVDSKNDKILEVALVKFDENTFEIIDTFSTLINPWIPIPGRISMLIFFIYLIFNYLKGEFGSLAMRA